MAARIHRAAHVFLIFYLICSKPLIVNSKTVESRRLKTQKNQ